jgi:alpha-tubulin suppressor-like RCC1 family protein
LSAAGGVKCWGTNFSGQLGDRTNVNRSAPIDVFGLTSGVIAIAAGSAHTCALPARGAMRCWGTNFSGQLGDGTNVNRSAPVDVSGLPSARPWVRWQWL